jgi:hypothetical protein
MTSVFLKTTLITTYKLNFDTLNLQKKKQKIYFKDKDINNKFLQLFFCKNLLLVSKNKYFLNNIKKYFSFRLGFFFFKKNIFFFFGFLNEII